MCFPLCRIAVFTLALSANAPGVHAQTFAVQLGQTDLGQLTFDGSSASASLVSTLDNTPLGVFDGTFTGTSKPAKTTDGQKVQEFHGISKSSRKSREVTVQIDSGVAVSTAVIPASEETKLSDVSAVPGNVMDPVQAVGTLLRADKGCPAPLTIYDGRRAIALNPKSSNNADGTLTCDIAYKVVAGPGHLSPLKISRAKMRITYALSDGNQRVTSIRLGSGVFKLTLTRTD